MQEKIKDDTISRQAVLSKIKEVCFSKEWVKFRADNGSNGQRDFLINYIEQLPPAQPTLCGYDIESLKTIAMILEKENMPPEKVIEVLTDTGRIVAFIIQDEFEKTLRNMREVEE